MATLKTKTGESVGTNSTSTIYKGGRADIEEVGVFIEERSGVEGYVFGVRFYENPDFSSQIGPDLEAPSEATGLAQHSFPARAKYFEIFVTNNDANTSALIDYSVKAQ